LQGKAANKNKSPAIVSASLILPLRIFMGATFLYAGLQHLTDASYFDQSKPGYIGHLIVQYSIGSPIHDFLTGFVAPNAVSFGYVVAVGEILIGVGTLLGLLYRIAAFVGLVLNFTFFLSATWNAFPFYFGSDIVFIMCWLTLILAGPQQGLSFDSSMAKHTSKLRWLAPTPVQLPLSPRSAEVEKKPVDKPIKLPDGARFYPGQVAEVNRAFDRIDSQFVLHDETRTILELVRAFVISLGVDRTDAAKILSGIRTLVERDAWQQGHSNAA